MKISRKVACLALSALAAGAVLPREGEQAAPPGPDRPRLEADFARKMSGATLLGRFTLDESPDGVPQRDAYRLGAVEKLEGEDDWRFEAEIRYGEKELELPIVVQVKWAGDTPVITLTDMPIPLMGTFTARVVVYGDRYAGIWSGADHGGQMFGRVVAAGESEEGAEEDGVDDG